MEPCQTVANPPFQWYGGKWELAEWILGLLPDHHTYVDVFGGAGGVMLRKEPSKVEVYNDLDAALSNFFRVCREDGPALASKVALTEYSRDMFDHCCAVIEQWKGVVPGGEGSRHAAWALAVAARMSMSGRIGGSWSRSLGHRRAGLSSSVARFLLLPDTILEVAARLKQVQIENLDFAQCLTDYDQPDTLFYCDPPYLPETRASGKGDVYRKEMNRDDHIRFLDAITAIKGLAVVSGYMHPLYAQRLQGWQCVEREVPCRSDNLKSGTRTEVLWIKQGQGN